MEIIENFSVNRLCEWCGGGVEGKHEREQENQ